MTPRNFMPACPYHDAVEPSEPDRRTLDRIMARLERSQAGEGRHKCAKCAYIAGYWDGLGQGQQLRLKPPTRDTNAAE